MRAPDNVSGAPETPRTAAADISKTTLEVMVAFERYGLQSPSLPFAVERIIREARAEALREVGERLPEALHRYWDRTREWDPMLNGTVDREMDGLDPNAPSLTDEQYRAVVDQRGVIIDRHQWEHDIMVGQRMSYDGYLKAAQDLVAALTPSPATPEEPKP